MRNYGYGKSRVKHIGKYELIVEFYSFKKAHFYIYLDNNKNIYYSGTDILPDNKQKMLDVYKSLKTVSIIKSFIEKRNLVK